MAQISCRTEITRPIPPSTAPPGVSTLQRILLEFASVLLPLGITPRHFCDLSREAFVRAAAANSRLRNGRVNYSRVAVQTGLSRASVTHVLTKPSRGARTSKAQSVTERVISGWKRDRRFSSAANKPNPLPIVGPSNSFVALVKRYAGDVPYRAVLVELQRIRWATIRSNVVHFRPSNHAKGKQDAKGLEAVAPVLIESLRIASATTGNGVSKSMHTLVVPVADRAEGAKAVQAVMSAAKRSAKPRRATAAKADCHSAAFVRVTILVSDDASESEV
jgi:hypothetical protein